MQAFIISPVVRKKGGVAGVRFAAAAAQRSIRPMHARPHTHSPSLPPRARSLAQSLDMKSFAAETRLMAAWRRSGVCRGRQSPHASSVPYETLLRPARRGLLHSSCQKGKSGCLVRSVVQQWEKAPQTRNPSRAPSSRHLSVLPVPSVERLKNIRS